MPASLPEPGQLFWASFSDAEGSEQSGRRPAMILSATAFHVISQRAFVVPVTSRIRGWPTEVALPSTMRTKGALLVDQSRFVDRGVRLFRYIETAPLATVRDVRELLATLIGLPAEPLA